MGSPKLVEIRRAVAGDAPALVDLQNQIYREGRWFVGDGPPTVQWLSQRLRSADPGMSLWLVAAEEAGDLCGWLELHRLAPQRMRHVATLTIAVAAVRRGQGIGSALMGRAFDWARQIGVRKVTLNVRAGNEGALRLYQRTGFVLEGRERDQVLSEAGFEDNLIMAKFLVSPGGR